MRLEIHVKPPGSAHPCGLDGRLDQSGGDALPPHRRFDAGVEQEGMEPTVPRHVDEADKAVCVEGADMGQAPGQDWREIPVLTGLPSRAPQPVQFVVGRKRIDPENYR